MLIAIKEIENALTIAIINLSKISESFFTGANNITFPID